MPEVRCKRLPFTVSNSMTDLTKIAEVARIVHYLKKHAVGKVIAAVKTQEDEVCLVMA
jgi:hypothetical protein